MKRYLRYDGIIREVILNIDANGLKDAEIHTILKDGTATVFHHHNPTEKAIDILRTSIGKEIHVKIEKEPEVK